MNRPSASARHKRKKTDGGRNDRYEPTSFDEIHVALLLRRLRKWSVSLIIQISIGLIYYFEPAFKSNCRGYRPTMSCLAS